MKLLLVLTIAALSNAAKLDKTYLPPNAQTSGGSGSFLETPISGPSAFNGPSRTSQFGATGNSQTSARFPENRNYAQTSFAQSDEFDRNVANYGRPERTQAALERNAGILRQYSQNDGDNFAYAFETENGIYAEENGVAANGVEAQGGYSYTGDDGQVYSIRYTADQNGFVPQGDHLPTAPPVPEEILKALEQNARDEAAGIYDDGSYNEAKYSDNYQYNSNNGNRGNGNSGRYNDNDDTIVTNSALFPEGSVRNRNGGALKNYLPPTRNAFGRRQPSFNSRDGYQY